MKCEKSKRHLKNEIIPLELILDDPSPVAVEPTQTRSKLRNLNLKNKESEEANKVRLPTSNTPGVDITISNYM